MIFGKLLGGLFGFAWLGFIGGLIGLFIGHQFDKALRRSFSGAGFVPRADHQVRIQELFFRLTFVAMGFLAKADGRVSKTEIQWAEQVMSRMNLSPDMRREAIGFFNQGKNAELDLDAELDAFREVVGRHATLVQMFLEIQIQAAYADGDLSNKELALLQRICSRLGISAMRFEIIHGRIRAERAFAQGQYQQQTSGSGYRPEEKLAQAYEVLGVTSSSSDADVKKAYRRLMSQHHPDKLVARGLPEEMMKIAKEKTQEIQAAYEAIKDARK